MRTDTIRWTVVQDTENKKKQYYLKISRRSISETAMWKKLAWAAERVSGP